MCCDCVSVCLSRSFVLTPFVVLFCELCTLRNSSVLPSRGLGNLNFHVGVHLVAVFLGFGYLKIFSRACSSGPFPVSGFYLVFCSLHLSALRVVLGLLLSVGVMHL